MPTSTWSLVQGLSGSLIRNHQALELARPVVAKSRLLLLGEARQSLQTRNSEQIVIKLIVYLCINNFTGSEIVEYEALFQQLEHFSMTQAKALMDAIPEPYLTALQQSILTIAIRFGAVSIVKALIQNGLDVDMATCHFEGDPLTPLQYACRCRHIEMVRVLLGATKDVERSFKMSTISHLFQRDIGPGRLGGTKATLHRIVGRLLILLLQAGIRFQHGDLLDSRFWKDDSLVQAFLRYGKINERARLSFLTDYTCLYIIRYQNDEEAAYCFEVLLGSGIILSPELTTSSLFRQCQRTLCEASSFGHSRVVNLLLAAGVVPVTECLAGATYANSIDLVNRFLAMGIKPNDLMSIEEDEGKHFGNVCTFQREFACNIPAETEPLFLNGDLTSLKTFTTPFAEAIRWQRHDIVALFQRTGKFESIPKLVNGQTRDIYHSVFAGAVEAGNVTLVADLLLSESDPNILSSLSSCFSLATLIGQDQIVSLLLHAGVRPNQTSVPIAVAVRNRRHLRWYLDSGALIVDEVLWLAARWGDADVAKELIMAGASMNIECTTSDTFSSCGICLTLPRPFCTPLGQAIKEGNLDVVQLLLENGADVCLRDHYYSVSALALAVRTGDEAMVRDMLARGADPNDPKALEEATHRSLSMIEILLEAFDHTYPKGNKSFGTRALRQAIWKGDVAHASLFSRYSDANFLDVCHDDGKDVRRNLLSHAIISQNASIVQILLGTGGNPNGTVSLRGSDRGPGFGSGSSRRTVLLEAIWTKDLGIVRLVHESGAAINCAAELGLARTPLQLAAEIGSFEIAEYLIVHGADVNGDPCIFRGGTALQLAAIQGYVGIAEHLVKNGADVNAARGRFQGRTAFEGAAEHGRLDMLLFLYHNGLDIVSDGGEQVRRAVEFANENGQRAAVSLVEQLSQSVASVPSLGLN
ncbi:ankyrin [Lophiostoma macrostomum CBS 122681]|uniref:Ankyrin n=1 Tax=Lophiostoma macrostomum CBS 122681 TaxID=1314788 RepID=A0A6A6SYH0_9PLEO|nr:ankyrin [Lophiostoma macrostomum CBS 122681]